MNEHERRYVESNSTQLTEIYHVSCLINFLTMEKTACK